MSSDPEWWILANNTKKQGPFTLYELYEKFGDEYKIRGIRKGDGQFKFGEYAKAHYREELAGLLIGYPIKTEQERLRQKKVIEHVQKKREIKGIKEEWTQRKENFFEGVIPALDRFNPVSYIKAATDFVLNTYVGFLTNRVKNLDIDKPYDLVFLQKKGLVSTKGIGQSISQIKGQVINRTRKSLRVAVSAGTYFMANGDYQNMSSRRDYNFILDPMEKKTLSIAASCINAGRPIPEEKDHFNGAAKVSEDVFWFLHFSSNCSSRTVQAGVWILTDNYSAYEIKSRLVLRNSYGRTQQVISDKNIDEAAAILDSLGIEHGLTIDAQTKNPVDEDRLIVIAWKYIRGENVEKNERTGIKWLKKAIKHHSVNAMADLGCFYLNTEFDSHNFKKGFKYCKRAAEKEIPVAMNNVGECYYNGDGVKKDFKKAYHWFKAAAEKGIAESVYYLGLMQGNGKIGNKDINEALRLFSLAAENKYSPAMYELGLMHLNGDGVEKDINKASDWFDKAADKNHKKALLELILLLCCDGYTAFTDYKQFIYAEMIGFSEAIDFLNSIKKERKPTPKEISNLNELCSALKKSSTLDAMNKLGKSYYDYDGRHISEYHNGLEYGKALFWFKKAADKGCVNSMMDMAKLYDELGFHYGKKTYNVPDKKEQFNSESIFWYAMAADKGNLEAMVKMGQRMDPRESWRWFKKAANKGSGKAMANIAHCYENGYSGRKKNIKKAEYWKKKAREHGADSWI